MIEPPSVSLEVSTAEQFVVEGPHAQFLLQGARRWVKASGLDELPNCRMSLLTPPRRHVGLGSGTQLALSIVAALNAWRQRPPLSATELVRCSGRGRRSAVGTHGFVHGGLIVESGKLAGDELAPLERRMPLPAEWRFVLVQAGHREGLYGTDERQAFESLPPVRDEVREALIHEVHTRMLPALVAEDCAAFGNSVYRFGQQAGSCFAPIQGGPYNGPRLAALVAEIRALGVHGVGQSSWGPTLFGLVPNQNEALRVCGELGS